MPLTPAPAEPLIGQAALMRMRCANADLTALAQQLIHRSSESPNDVHALMDLATVMYLAGQEEIGLSLQHFALEIQQLYHLPEPEGEVAARVLALVAPGDLMANTPLELLLENSDIALDLLYLSPGVDTPGELPEHDVLFVAIGESDANLPLLKTLGEVLDEWPRPVVNHPKNIARLARDSVSKLLGDAPGTLVPPTVRVDKRFLQAVATGGLTLAEKLQDGGFPIIVHPVDSHAGRGLERLEDAASLADYLSNAAEGDFFISPYVDYADADGLFRKYRIALVQGRPFICHMAISSHWMIHYLNAGMEQSAEKREEEARCMASFDHEFAPRHAQAFEAIATRTGLDYLAVDCAQTRDGKLLVFEVDTAMIVHALDAVELFPYKQATMQKLFTAFRQMLVDSKMDGQPS